MYNFIYIYSELWWKAVLISIPEYNLYKERHWQKYFVHPVPSCTSDKISWVCSPTIFGITDRVTIIF
jgi:hypothetical protein